MTNALEFHKKHKGKIEISVRTPITSQEDLKLAYTPGVAEPCLEIAQNKELVYEYTRKNNMVAVVTDGSAVLGLGNIGPEASLPVMEGKCVLFKEFAQVDAFPIALTTQDVDEIVETVVRISPMFGGINLEDIAAPRCFEVEEKLRARLNIPVFHDDQHGTAIVVLAGLFNAAKILEKELSKMVIVVNGVGAAGVAIANLLLHVGVGNMLLVDSEGIICSAREGLNNEKKKLLEKTNAHDVAGSLADAVRGADVFIGVSKPGVLTAEMVRTMAPDPIIFALSNPTPEIMPDEAKAGGAAIVATGRSDFENQINNVLAFPGVFRGLLDARLPEVTTDMKVAAARAIADYVKVPSRDRIIPEAIDRGVAAVVAETISQFSSYEAHAQQKTAVH